MGNVKVGCRIYRTITRAPKEMVERFRDIPTSNIGDQMNRLYCMYGIQSMNNRKMIGTAVTVKAPMGDNLMVGRALELAEPGDVLVIDSGGTMNRSTMGEMMFTYAQVRGLAGVVVDGCIRDIDGTRALNIPVFARGVTPQGPYKKGPGEINVPIACGGQAVLPGDIIAGDPDGVVVIHKEDAQYVVEEAIQKLDFETKKLASYRGGELDRKEYLGIYEDLLQKAGVVYID